MNIHKYTNVYIYIYMYLVFFNIHISYMIYYCALFILPHKLQKKAVNPHQNGWPYSSNPVNPRLSNHRPHIMENRSQTHVFDVQIRQKPPPEIYTCIAWLIFSYTMSVQGWETSYTSCLHMGGWVSPYNSWTRHGAF